MNFYVKYIRPILYLLIIAFCAYGLILDSEELFFFGKKAINWALLIFALLLLLLNLRMTFRR